jgi:hypothetical protein
LCHEFGWTPKELEEQNARDIEELIFVLNTIHNLRKQGKIMKKQLPLFRKKFFI